MEFRYMSRCTLALGSTPLESDNFLGTHWRVYSTIRACQVTVQIDLVQPQKNK